MKLILYPLLILMILAGFNQLLLHSNTNLAYTSSGAQAISGDYLGFTQVSSDAIFNVDMTTGFILLIISLVALGVVAGIRILGSGLSVYSVQLIHKSCVYYGLWGVFSVLSFTAFNSIPIFGLFLWLGMTLIYSVGFFQTLTTGGGDD